MESIRALDSRDITILEHLQKEGRISLSDLGRRIGLSQPAVSERVARLEADGVILGYRAIVNPNKLGIKMSAIIRLSTSHENIKNCMERFDQTPNIIEYIRATGEECFFIRAIFSEPSELETLVDQISQFGTVKTSVFMRSKGPKVLGRELLT